MWTLNMEERFDVIHPIRKAAAVFAVLLPAFSGRAASNGTYEVAGSLAGVCGSVGSSNGNGLEVSATAGWFSSGRASVNGSWTVQPGLWGAETAPHNPFVSLATPCGGAVVQVPS